VWYARKENVQKNMGSTDGWEKEMIAPDYKGSDILVLPRKPSRTRHRQFLSVAIQNAPFCDWGVDGLRRMGNGKDLARHRIRK